jgi:stage II sporulation protein R
MKKFFLTIVCLVVIAATSLGAVYSKGSSEESTESISEKLIRFHVIANSDSTEDQALKLKVRDKVLEYISPKLKNSKSIEESREILRKNDDNIRKIAENIIKKNGYNYSVKTTLSKEKFPIKTYGNITLAQGEYEAYRILIGSGGGQNWWCVMFPPLCFIDITKGEVSYKETEKSMKKVLTEEQYKAVNNRLIEDNSNISAEEDKIVIKFKIYELIKSLFL